MKSSLEERKRESANESQKVKTASGLLAGGQMHGCDLARQQDHGALRKPSPFCATSGLCLKDIVLSKQASHTGQTCGSPYRRSPQSSQIHEHEGAGTKNLVFIGDVACLCELLYT